MKSLLLKDRDYDILKLIYTRGDLMKSNKILSSDKDRKIKDSKSKIKSRIIIIVFLAAFLTVSYTVFAQPVAFDMITAKKAGNGSWDISFTKMNQKSILGYAKETHKPVFTNTEATFHVLLMEPGDAIKYNLTIKNNGTIDAKVTSVNIIPENEPGDLILYSISGIKTGDEILAGDEVSVVVSAKYNNKTSDREEARKNVKIIVNFEQK